MVSQRKRAHQCLEEAGSIVRPLNASGSLLDTPHALRDSPNPEKITCRPWQGTPAAKQPLPKVPSCEQEGNGPSKAALKPGLSNSLGEEDTEEFLAVMELDNGWTDPDRELSSPIDLPVPVHRYPRAEVSALLQKYAGVAVEELDWEGCQIGRASCRERV